MKWLQEESSGPQLLNDLSANDCHSMIIRCQTNGQRQRILRMVKIKDLFKSLTLPFCPQCGRACCYTAILQRQSMDRPKVVFVLIGCFRLPHRQHKVHPWLSCHPWGRYRRSWGKKLSEWNFLLYIFGFTNLFIIGIYEHVLIWD